MDPNYDNEEDKKSSENTSEDLNKTKSGFDNTRNVGRSGRRIAKKAKGRLGSKGARGTRGSTGEVGTAGEAAAAEEAATGAGAAAAGGEAAGAAAAGGEAAGGVAAGVGTAAGGVSGTTVAAIFLLILLIILLIAAIFFVVFGGVQGVRAGTAPDCEAVGGTCRTSCQSSEILDTTGASCSATLGQFCCLPPEPPPTQQCAGAPTCPLGDYLACLKTQFNISMGGSYSSSNLKTIYNGFGIGFKYPTFLKWFKSAGAKVTVSSYSVCPSSMWCSGAWATVTSGGQMTLYQKFLSASTRYQEYILVHEAAHMAMQAGSTANNTQFTLYKNAYTNGQNRNCYNSVGILKTYPWHIIPSSQLTYDRKVQESWADSVGNTVLCPANTTCPSNGGGGTSIYDFPGTCSYIYNYVKSALGC